MNNPNTILEKVLSPVTANTGFTGILVTPNIDPVLVTGIVVGIVVVVGVTVTLPPQIQLVGHILNMRGDVGTTVVIGTIVTGVAVTRFSESIAKTGENGTVIIKTKEERMTA